MQGALFAAAALQLWCELLVTLAVLLPEVVRHKTPARMYNAFTMAKMCLENGSAQHSRTQVAAYAGSQPSVLILLLLAVNRGGDIE